MDSSVSTLLLLNLLMTWQSSRMWATMRFNVGNNEITTELKKDKNFFFFLKFLEDRIERLKHF